MDKVEFRKHLIRKRIHLDTLLATVEPFTGTYHEDLP